MLSILLSSLFLGHYDRNGLDFVPTCPYNAEAVRLVYVMWRANKPFILMLAAGLLLLGVLYLLLQPVDPLLADRVCSTGLCLLLFAVALACYLSVRRHL